MHVLAFCDTSDPYIGVIGSNSSNLLREKLMEISYDIEYDYYFEEFENKGFTKDTLEKVLKSLNSSIDDILVFYYNGHGIRAVEQQSLFPQMCFGTNDDANFVPIQYVINSFDKQPAHLILVISNCGNSIATRVSPKDIAPDTTVYHNRKLSSPINDRYLNRNDSINLDSDNTERYKNLFNDFIGTLAITSSGPTQHSWGNTQYGSFFDVVFWALMEAVGENKLPADWITLFKSIQEKTDEIAFRSTTPPTHQRPYFEIIDNR